jgi:serine/threonine protein kinase
MISFKNSQCLNPNCLYNNPFDNLVCQRCGSSLLVSGRYRALRQLGCGGFARTFEAVDEYRLNTSCVIKQFCPIQQSSTAIEKSRELFKQEGVILKTLAQHPKIPKLLAFFEQKDQLYIIQEFIEGQDLFQEANQKGPLNEEAIGQLLAQLLPVLQFIHKRHIIHRDIKPSNIIRRWDDELILIDFGSSHFLGNNITNQKSTITGTPAYAPPEQMRGKVLPNSDLYSLGVTCIRLLTGCFPRDDGSDPLFDRDRRQWRWREFVSNISPELTRILEKLLQAQTSDRYQSATDVLEALEDIPSGEQTYMTSNKHRDRGGRTKEINTDNAYLMSNSDAFVEVDYSILEDLLAAGKYQEADRETWNLMLKISDREKEGSLSINSVEQFPLSDLRTIDRLWQTYSDGRFGLSIQKQIYQSLGGTRGFDYEIWKTFGEQVGWYVNGDWLNYQDLHFDSSAMSGHLPVCFVDVLNRMGVARGVCGWWRLGFVCLVQRLDECYAQELLSSRDCWEENFPLLRN